MAEENVTTTDQPAQQNVQLVVDDREARTVYVNNFFIRQSPEEIIIDLGVSMAQPSQTGQQQVLMKISDRAILSYMTAKRLASALSQLIKRHEQQFGELQAPGAQRR